MRRLLSATITSFSLLALAACGDDGGGGGGPGVGGESRGGPEALSGFTWSTSMSQDGIDFDFGFEFGPSTLVAVNTCTYAGDSLTAEIEVPIRYRYHAEVLESAYAGDESCFVSIEPFSYDFEIVGGKLVMTSGDERVELSPSGGNSGVYGEWSYTDQGLTLTYTMGAGKVTVSARGCENGAQPATSARANFKNYIVIQESGENTVGDESFNCNVGIAADTIEYRFDGNTLVMTSQGQDMRFAPR